MGLNRAMRRKQVREQMHDWVRMGEMDKVRTLSKNGITRDDLNESYRKGHEDGYKAGTDKTLRTVYAGVVLLMLDTGADEATAISFLRDLDNRLITSISDGEDIEEVFDRTGVRLMLKEDFDRVKEVEEVEELARTSRN